MDLTRLLENAIRQRPSHVAVEEAEEGSITYAELGALSDKLRDRLLQMGVGRGHRVGLYLSKSIDAVAAIHGILKAGAAYVPVDPSSPAARNAYILNDCSVSAVIAERPFTADLSQPCIALQGSGGGGFLRAALAAEVAPSSAARSAAEAHDTAYVLYTSGSTGRPKGVMIPHQAVAGFVEWCSRTFDLSAHDRFACHAPLHFDISVHDLFVPLHAAATLVLIRPALGKNPRLLAPWIAHKKITTFFSTPSVLTMLSQHADLSQFDYSCLRNILYSGEAFPVSHLRALQAQLPHPRYYNLFGPTETTVCCTWHEIGPSAPADLSFPIGKTRSPLRTRVCDDSGREAAEGELCVHGVGVMQGYWNLEEETARAFFEDEGGSRWYRTGDMVFTNSDGDYQFTGRRDRMVKRRGFRVELGEIEATLHRHPAIRDAAVISEVAEDFAVRIKALVCWHGERRPSVVELKQFCVQHLPSYMVPDTFGFPDSLPRTSTDKIDYQKLKQWTA